jgi:hypothetical protein
VYDRCAVDLLHRARRRSHIPILSGGGTVQELRTILDVSARLQLRDGSLLGRAVAVAIRVDVAQRSRLSPRR